MAKFTSPELSLRFPFTALHCTPHGYPPTLGHNALLPQPLQGGKIASLSSTSVYRRQDTEQKTGKEKGERTSVVEKIPLEYDVSVVGLTRESRTKVLLMLGGVVSSAKVI